ncbi:hypothetical protein, partial [Sphingobacterium sp. UBA7253]
YNLKYLLCILNSGVGNYMYSLLIQEQGKVFAQVKLTFLRKIPIKQANQSIQSIFDNICTYTLATNKFKDFDKHVPNSHIAQLFEEVIDAMVMELYFKEDFEKAGIEFIKYAERDFESIEGKPQSEQIEIIHRAYQKLREKDNEIRNNLKLMDIKLADIVMPIKAAK